MGINNFTITSGSTIGVHHVYFGYNNQDSLKVSYSPERIVGIVTDGCSCGNYYVDSKTEFGSIFAAQWLANYIAEYPGLIGNRALNFFGEKLCEKMNEIMNIMDIETAHKTNFISNHLLFTVLGFIIEKENTYIFGAGDGVYMINGKFTIIDPDKGKDRTDPQFIENAPDYIAYKFYDNDVDFKILEKIKTDKVDSIMVGTDGLEEIEHKKSHFLKDGNIQGGIDQFLSSEFQQKDAIKNRLYDLARVNNQLRDDTTLIIAKRKK